MNNEYRKEYKEFIDSYKSAVTSAEEVGVTISRLTQRFCDANTEYGLALCAFNSVAAGFEQTVDETSGKPLSSAKSKVLADATPEASRLIMAKTDVGNIEQMIMSLKSLQKGIILEQNNAGVM